MSKLSKLDNQLAILATSINQIYFHSMYNNNKDDAMLGTDRETSIGRTALSFRVPEKVLSAII